MYNNANIFYVLALEDISNVNLYKNSMVVNDMFGGDLYYHSTNAISPTLPSSQEIVVDLNSLFSVNLIFNGGAFPTSFGGFKLETSYDKFPGFVSLNIFE